MIRRLIPLVLLVIMLAGCSKNDGDWEPMKWKATSSVKEEKGNYIVEASGATLTFTCKNYPNPWLDGARINNTDYVYPDQNGGDFRNLKGPWFTAHIQGSNLEIVIAENKTSMARAFLLHVTAGDIFHTFSIVQKAP